MVWETRYSYLLKVTSADTVVLSMCTVKRAAVLSAAITDSSKY